MQRGFTLIELLIVIAIVGIFAAIAVPQYQTYTKKAKFSEVVSATAPFKLAVEVCFAETNTITGCTNALNGIPAAPQTAGVVQSVAVADGVITATGTAVVDSATYILTPTPQVNGAVALTWAKTGTCTGLGLC